MNSSTWILIGESILILVSLIIGIVVYAWRKKTRLLAALDGLLSNISEAEPERIKMLTGRLKKTYPIDEAKAQELSNEIFRSERMFIKQLIQLLLGSRIDQITHFNEEVYKLSTPYWELFPLELGTTERPNDQTKNTSDIPEPEADGQPNDNQGMNTATSKEYSETELNQTKSRSDVNDAGEDGSSKTADQALSKQEPSEPSSTENTNDSMPGSLVDENAEEPSWDDAFDQAAEGLEATEIKLEENGDGGNQTQKIPESEAAS